MTTVEQNLLKARVTLAMRDEFGKVPTEKDIEYTFRQAWIVYKAVLGTHYIKPQQQKSGQLPLFYDRVDI